MTSVSLATNEAGQAVAQPAHSQYPMVAEDITDELLAALNAKLAALGLEVTRRA
jgi:Mg2+/Co2+ transporter CorC